MSEDQIRIACPSCGKKMKVGADRAGRKVRCRGCQEKVAVPEVEDAATDAPASKPARSSKPAKPATPGSRPAWILPAAAAALVLLVGGGLAAFVLGGDGGAREGGPAISSVSGPRPSPTGTAPIAAGAPVGAGTGSAADAPVDRPEPTASPDDAALFALLRDLSVGDAATARAALERAAELRPNDALVSAVARRREAELAPRVLTILGTWADDGEDAPPPAAAAAAALADRFFDTHGEQWALVEEQLAARPIPRAVLARLAMAPDLAEAPDERELVAIASIRSHRPDALAEVLVGWAFDEEWARLPRRRGALALLGSPAFGEEARTALVRGLDDRHLLDVAAAGLVERGDGEALVGALGHADAVVRGVAAGACARLRASDPTVAERLAALAANDPEAWVRVQAFAGLGKALALAPDNATLARSLATPFLDAVAAHVESKEPPAPLDAALAVAALDALGVAPSVPTDTLDELEAGLERLIAFALAGEGSFGPRSALLGRAVGRVLGHHQRGEAIARAAATRYRAIDAPDDRYDSNRWLLIQVLAWVEDGDAATTELLTAASASPPQGCAKLPEAALFIRADAPVRALVEGADRDAWMKLRDRPELWRERYARHAELADAEAKGWAAVLTAPGRGGSIASRDLAATALLALGSRASHLAAPIEDVLAQLRDAERRLGPRMSGDAADLLRRLPPILSAIRPRPERLAGLVDRLGSSEADASAAPPDGLPDELPALLGELERPFHAAFWERVAAGLIAGPDDRRVRLAALLAVADGRARRAVLAAVEARPTPELLPFAEALVGP